MEMVLGHGIMEALTAYPEESYVSKLSALKNFIYVSDTNGETQKSNYD